MTILMQLFGTLGIIVLGVIALGIITLVLAEFVIWLFRWL